MYIVGLICVHVSTHRLFRAMLTNLTVCWCTWTVHLNSSSKCWSLMLQHGWMCCRWCYAYMPVLNIYAYHLKYFLNPLNLNECYWMLPASYSSKWAQATPPLFAWMSFRGSRLENFYILSVTVFRLDPHDTRKIWVVRKRCSVFWWSPSSQLTSQSPLHWRFIWGQLTASVGLHLIGQMFGHRG